MILLVHGRGQLVCTCWFGTDRRDICSREGTVPTCLSVLHLIWWHFVETGVRFEHQRFIFAPPTQRQN